MEKREQVLRTFSLIASCSMESRFSEYEFDSAYRKLRSDYPDYTLLDLLMISKIDRMLTTNKITSNIHDQLIDLYDLRISTDEQLCSSELEEQDENILWNRLVDIDKVLVKYGLVPTDFDDFIDSTIKRRKYNDIDPNPMQKILIENGYK